MRLAYLGLFSGLWRYKRLGGVWAGIILMYAVHILFSLLLSAIIQSAIINLKVKLLKMHE